MREGEWTLVRQRKGAVRQSEKYRVPMSCTENARASDSLPTTTFFFKNFPPDFSVKDLWFIFCKIRDLDLFCPKKLDKSGKKFGFVRFRSRQAHDVEGLLWKINRIWIGSYKMVAWSPKFDRRSSTGTKPPPNMKPSKFSSCFPLQNKGGGTLKEGSSFKDVVLGATKGEGEKVSSPRPLCFNSTHKERSWAEKSKVATLKEGMEWEDIGDEIVNEVGGRLKLLHTGANLVLISNQDGTGADISGLENWTESWFDYFRNWKPEDVSRRKKVWTQWFGVPCHAWNDRFFRSMSVGKQSKDKNSGEPRIMKDPGITEEIKEH